MGLKVWKYTGPLLLFSLAGLPQDVPPDLILLARIKTHMRDELARLPNYTCLETVNRFHRYSETAQMKPLDTVRLEVIYSDHHEWYGSPGDRNLNVSNPSKFVGSGLMGSGAFASALHNILGGAHFVYRGEETLANRTAVKFDFLFPRQPIAFEINIVGGLGNVGEKGSIWVDRDSLDLIRMEANADDIPEYLPLGAQSTAVNYARTQIGSGTALLAQQADIRLVETSGADNFDHFEFTHCRAFSAQSSIRFDTLPDSAAPVAANSPDTPRATASPFLPALLQVTVQLSTTITDRDAVGKLIEGKVLGDVVSKGKAVVQNGAAVRGRIRRLEHYQGKTTGQFGDYIVGLEFTEIDASAGALPFYADLLSMDARPEIKPTLSEKIPFGKINVTLAELPGVASFFVAGNNFTIPAGFRTVWRTRGPIRGM